MDTGPAARGDIARSLHWAARALDAGQPDVARELLLAAIEDDPTCAEAWLLLAEALKEPYLAERCRRFARTIDPGLSRD